MKSYFWITFATMLAANAGLTNATHIKAYDIQEPLTLAESHSDSLVAAKAIPGAAINNRMEQKRSQNSLMPQ